MYVNVVFVIRCLYSTVSLTLVREQCFTRIIYYYNILYMYTCYLFTSYLLHHNGSVICSISYLLHHYVLFSVQSLTYSNIMPVESVTYFTVTSAVCPLSCLLNHDVSDVCSIPYLLRCDINLFSLLLSVLSCLLHHNVPVVCSVCYWLHCDISVESLTYSTVISVQSLVVCSVSCLLPP